MEITKAVFLTSAATLNAYRTAAAMYDCPEVCFVGRSNVGKSTFINMLVDLPGYGYAAASKREQQGWGTLIEGYLRNTEKLKQAFLLLDCRHEPSVADKQMINYFHYFATPFTVVATKCDKLSKAQLSRAVTMLSGATALGRDNILCVSHNGDGRDRVLTRLETILAE